ncbi:bifunctional ornithine acetyltransferase/N-acetylglutamate synthase [Hydrogenovibrio sp. SC-1]|uniref:bifunctional glutamate N-acetyltransferase/amino-acid acetyltransferase ArgJ n=1 Tax=Hydrogenovibrio sp. SC-1 TaxID=2065820 RepID=UPI000C7E2755|nr:bifunctional glutamate N-acetyltransferase/amino-acid acetyltransferase ArgJ [Hydrogenovibrio sp. SC-1]PLA75165.1 bifunctional ornithine acetyltransferase/N-acetylglutamate synthase [Hydrogenovibrio sp. SC-1]
MNLDSMHPVAGVYLGTTAAKIKKSGAEDLLVVAFHPGSRTAATFTQNAFCAAPVVLAKQHLASQATEALIINSGNANAGTGEQGLADAKQSCQWVASELGIALEAVLPFSTGVIGENLPMEKLALGVPNAIANQAVTGWDAAAKAIMTTDTCAKKLSRQFEIDGHLVTLNGIAKGSGMIHPNMATMLGFAATDAKISQECLDQALKSAVAVSFNRITVDGDTSTNDACTLTATQLADMPEITDMDSEAYQCFYQALEAMMIELAQMIVRDGEGATKFVSVIVEKGATAEECLKVAHAVALSPLVKTALFASDPNWGRILAAVGRSGLVDFDINALQIYLGTVLLVENGGRADSYTEAAGQAVMNEADITIRIVLNRGEVSETVWTTDFSYDYVRINAEYRS